MDMKDAHIGIQVTDLGQACTTLTELLGLTFAEPIQNWPVAVRIGDTTEHSEGHFTVSRQGPPYLEVTENVANSKIWHSSGSPISFHHLGFWVEDVGAASDALAAAGYPMEAGGLNEAGGYRYAYHLVNGLRIEVADADARPTFERWATTGQADGIAEEFNAASVRP
jgi:catechol 2,3-dioxygenase-like lactoylglutathione lyase family enzyme